MSSNNTVKTENNTIIKLPTKGTAVTRSQDNSYRDDSNLTIVMLEAPAVEWDEPTKAKHTELDNYFRMKYPSSVVITNCELEDSDFW